MNVLDPFEEQQIREQVVADQSQIHDEGGDVWSRHADGPKRDPAADARIRAELAAEQRGEYDPDTGQWRRCRWESA